MYTVFEKSLFLQPDNLQFWTKTNKLSNIYVKQTSLFLWR